MDSEESSDEQRTPADMVSSFIIHAPPGEVNEVIKDVKGIVNDDELTEEQIKKVLPKYMRLQLTPVKIEKDSDQSVILSTFNDLGNSKYFDPRSKQSFQYNHITETISDIQAWQPDSNAEPWRSVMEQEWIKYTSEHYHEGTGSVFSSVDGDIITMNACLEGHQFQSKKFWNGRWRSVWTISFNPAHDKQSDLKGLIRLHVHYYEEGNVQLVGSKHCDHRINITKPEQLANDIVDVVKEFENDYQRAISENYQTMSDTTFKALRRPLPVIRSKIEWNKLQGYKIGSELKQQ